MESLTVTPGLGYNRTDVAVDGDELDAKERHTFRFRITHVRRPNSRYFNHRVVDGTGVTLSGQLHHEERGVGDTRHPGFSATR